MVLTPEGFTSNIPTTPNPYVSTKKPSAIKSLHQFTESLDVKHKTVVCRFGAAKEKREAIKKSNVLWKNIAKLCVNTKINQKVRESPYRFILNHPQVVQYPISNYCICVSIDENSKKESIPKLLLQVSLR